MSQYLLAIYQPDGNPPAPDILGAIMRDVGVVRDEMKAAGAWVYSAGLLPASTAKVVRARKGEMVTTDGPFAESKEHIGGFTIIRAPDIEAALRWGRRLSQATTLPIEVRPMHDADG